MARKITVRQRALFIIVLTVKMPLD